MLAQINRNRILALGLSCLGLYMGWSLLRARGAPPECERAQDATPKAPESGREDPTVIDRFTVLFASNPRTWPLNKWLGIPTLQNPLDVWITQEIISEVKPDFVIETGTFAGGSAALWATILQEVNPEGRVITIDITDGSHPWRKAPILQRRVDFLHGSSTAQDIVDEVKRRVSGRSVIVILDSLHTKEHVLNELRAYAPLVPTGSYIVVQDGVINGHPFEGGTGPGPYEAVEAFLAEDDSFVADRDRERLMMTFNPKGFLKRIK